ncbi:hypothetical protein Q8A73_014490 [Channa argus]|nr:hypothetical protein Q8A73_014490 [Channa argus]
MLPHYSAATRRRGSENRRDSVEARKLQLLQFEWKKQKECVHLLDESLQMTRGDSVLPLIFHSRPCTESETETSVDVVPGTIRLFNKARIRFHTCCFGTSNLASLNTSVLTTMQIPNKQSPTPFITLPSFQQTSEDAAHAFRGCSLTSLLCVDRLFVQRCASPTPGAPGSPLKPPASLTDVCRCACLHWRGPSQSQSMNHTGDTERTEPSMWRDESVNSGRRRKREGAKRRRRRRRLHLAGARRPSAAVSTARSTAAAVQLQFKRNLMVPRNNEACLCASALTGQVTPASCLTLPVNAGKDEITGKPGVKQQCSSFPVEDVRVVATCGQRRASASSGLIILARYERLHLFSARHKAAESWQESPNMISCETNHLRPPRAPTAYFPCLPHSPQKWTSVIFSPPSHGAVVHQKMVEGGDVLEVVQDSPFCAEARLQRVSSRIRQISAGIQMHDVSAARPASLLKVAKDIKETTIQTPSQVIPSAASFGFTCQDDTTI